MSHWFLYDITAFKREALKGLWHKLLFQNTKGHLTYLFVYLDFHTWLWHWHHFRPFFFPSLCPLVSSTPVIHDHIVNWYYINVCVLVCINKHNILSQFSVAPLSTCLGLTTWHWITYQGAHPWRVMTLLSSINCLQLAITQCNF